MQQPDLEARGVGKRYSGHVAVDDLSFSVARGSFFSILGPSGCGKTTLLRMIAGFLAPDGGDIHIGGVSMAGVPPNRRPVNMVFQHLALFLGQRNTGSYAIGAPAMLAVVTKETRV